MNKRRIKTELMQLLRMLRESPSDDHRILDTIHYHVYDLMMGKPYEWYCKGFVHGVGVMGAVWIICETV